MYYQSFIGLYSLAYIHVWLSLIHKKNFPTSPFNYYYTSLHLSQLKLSIYIQCPFSHLWFFSPTVTVRLSLLIKSDCRGHQGLPCSQTQLSLPWAHFTSTFSSIQQSSNPTVATPLSGLLNPLLIFFLPHQQCPLNSLVATPLPP